MCSIRFVACAVFAAALALPGVAAAQIVPTLEDVLKIDYFDNANTPNAPDGKVRITNSGDTEGVTPGQIGPADLCAMIYVFRPDQQMAACCGCRVTHNGYLKLSVNNDLTHNPLTNVPLPSGAIKILSTLPSTTPGPAGSSPECNPADFTALTAPTPGIRAWGTHIQEASPVVSFLVTETPFQDATLSASELEILALNCEFIVGNLVPPGLGSGAGLCKCDAESGGSQLPW
jgi:hypothetical protein